MINWRKISVVFAGALVGLLVGATVLSAPPASAQGGGLSMLGELTSGEWTVRYRNGTGPAKVCLRSGQELIGLRHRGKNCSRFVVEEGAKRVTVQYTCEGDGYGRTNIRSETDALVQIESQGIAGGQPFRFSAEARRTGGC